MKRLINPSQSQVIALGVLLTGVGAMFSPPLQVVAQPATETAPPGAASVQATGTPQPLATPPASSDTASSATTRSITTQAVGTITGQGTVGNIAKFTGANSIGNSVLYESGGKVGIGTTAPAGLFSVSNSTAGISAIYGVSAGNCISGLSSGAIGLYGLHTTTTGSQSGVLGETHSNSANAVGTTGTILSTAPGADAAGVRGINRGTNSNGYGVYGSHAGGGTGVYGVAPSGNGVLGESASGVGVHGRYTGTSGTQPGVLGETNSTSSSPSGVNAVGAVGVLGIVTTTSPGGFSAGVRGINKGTGGLGIGVYGSQAGSGYGVYGYAPSGYGLVGSSDSGAGLHAYSSSGVGVEGTSDSSYGVTGTSSYGNGVKGTGFVGVEGASTATNGGGVVGTGYIGVTGNALTNNSNSQGVRGDALGGSGYAGVFVGRTAVFGNLAVTGTLSKGAGSFKIDHPLHPATEYLSHSFVESPDMMNVYNGNTKTNARGEAWVQMPDYFSALNSDFRYQLTPMGQFAQAIIGQKIRGNRFLIRTDKPNVEVSWQVTGVRHDAYARQHRIRVEETKTGADRGKYLYPAGFGFGKDKQIGAEALKLAKR